VEGGFSASYTIDVGVESDLDKMLCVGLRKDVSNDW
jgi:hypothetical protein